MMVHPVFAYSSVAWAASFVLVLVLVIVIDSIASTRFPKQVLLVFN